MAAGRWPMADARWPMADGRGPRAEGRGPRADEGWHRKSRLLPTVPASGLGTEEAVANLKGAELAAFYKQWVRPDNSTLLVVGDTTLDAVKPLLEQRFGGWRAASGEKPAKNIATVALPEKPRVLTV